MNFRIVTVAAIIAAIPLAASSTNASTSAPIANKPGPGESRQVRPHDEVFYCDPNGFESFAGNNSEYAGGQQSGILAGNMNQACRQFDGIAAGKFNIEFGNGQASFIGAGLSNSVSSSYYSFVGAGNAAFMEGAESGSVAGQSDVVIGASAFVGAGANDNVSGGDGFVGAGSTNAAGLNSFVGAGSNESSPGQYSGVVSGAGNDAGGFQQFIGAGQQNVVGGTVARATNGFVGAGSGNAALGDNAFVGSGAGNNATGDDSFVGAGGTNTAGASGFVGAGSANTAGSNSFVGGGYANGARGSGAFIGAGGMAAFQAGSKTVNSAAGTDAFVGAGDGNIAGTAQAVVGGGVLNRILATTAGGGTGAVNAVIFGGYENIIEATASGGAAYAVLAGGLTNLVSGATAAIGGGAKNDAAGSYGTIPGGISNRAAGTGSFAAGTKSGALHDGTFVWSDNAGSAALSSTAAYQFLARASGGFYLYSNAAATAGVKLAPGSGAWASLSDRNMKSAILPLDGAAVLDRVVRLPVSAWSYTSERGVRHVGPMAQDFYAAFKVGEDDRHIATIDEDGVTLAAIKSLYEKSEQNNASAERANAALRGNVSKMQRALAKLAAQVDHLEHR
jgi:hypothetical protein